MATDEIPTLWYENDNGDRWLLPEGNSMLPPPPGFRYQRSRFPNEVHDTLLDCADGKSTRLGSFNTQWGTQEGILAMARPSLRNRWLQLVRTGRFQPVLSLRQAILRHVVSCERCLNVLLFEYGTDDGYALGSREWQRCGTSCELCKRPPTWSDIPT